MATSTRMAVVKVTFVNGAATKVSIPMIARDPEREKAEDRCRRYVKKNFHVPVNGNIKNREEFVVLEVGKENDVSEEPQEKSLWT